MADEGDLDQKGIETLLSAKMKKARNEETSPKSPSSELVCPACGNPVKASAHFCGSCGAQQPIIPICPRCGAPMPFGYCMVCDIAIVVNENPPPQICPHCGSPLSGKAKFCTYCGRKTI